MISQKQTLNNFIIQDSNELAVKAVLLATNKKITYSPIFIYGKTGSGKTHLLKAIISNIKNTSKKIAIYVIAKKFINDLIFSIKNREARESFEQKYRNNDLLIVEDIQLFAEKNRTQQELLVMLKEAQIRERQIILSANSPPNLIENLSDDLKIFCSGGLVIEIERN